MQKLAAAKTCLDLLLRLILVISFLLALKANKEHLLLIFSLILQESMDVGES